MKKVLSVLLCITLLLSLAIPVFATETTSTVLSLTLDPSMESYTLTIPATVELDAASKKGSISVELTDVNLVWSHSVAVFMTAANGVEGENGSYLVNTDDESLKIHYNLTDAMGSMYSHGRSYPVADYFISADGEVTENGGYINLEIDGDYPGAGTYTDTLTFTVKLS